VFMGIIKDAFAGKGWRFWLYWAMLFITAGLMVISFLLPWWAADMSLVLPTENTIVIHPYGLEQHLGPEYTSYIASSIEMPVWFTPFMWAYLGVSVGLILFSPWLKGRKGKFLLGGVGLSYIIVAVIAVLFTMSRLNNVGGFSVPLQGYVEYGAPQDFHVTTSLKFGYYMAYGVGLIGIILGLTRDVIIGKKSRLST